MTYSLSEVFTNGNPYLESLGVAMRLAARTAIPDAKSSASVDMSTSFLQPAGKAGETIVARGKVYHRSTTMCFCEAELWNGDKLVAKAMGTFKAIKRVDIAKKLTHEGDDAPATPQQD